MDKRLLGLRRIINCLCMHTSRSRKSTHLLPIERTEKFSQIFKKHNIQPIFKLIRKVGQILLLAKDEYLFQHLVSIRSCEVVVMCAWAKRGGCMMRVQEHMRYMKKGDIEKSAIAMQSCENKHFI